MAESIGDARDRVLEGVDMLAQGEAASMVFEESTDGVPELCAEVLEQLGPISAALERLTGNTALTTSPVEASQKYTAGSRLIHRTMRGARDADNAAVVSEAYRFDYNDRRRSLGKAGVRLEHDIERAAISARSLAFNLGRILIELSDMTQVNEEAVQQSAQLRQHATEQAHKL